MAHVKVIFASLLAVLCALTVRVSAEDAPSDASGRTPTPSQQGTTNDKGMQPIGGDTKPAPAEVTTAPAVASKPAQPAAIPPAGGRLIVLDGKQVYVDQNNNVIGAAASGGPGASKDPTADQKRKEREEAAARVDQGNRLRAAIRLLGTSGWREARETLLSYGKAAVPYLIDAMGNTEPDGSAAPASYQLGGHIKAVESRATRQRTRGDVCAELLTDMVSNHSNFKGELPTLDQADWQAWWKDNGDKITFGN